MSFADIQSREVAWYLKNGAYPRERLALDSYGRMYVIGDFSWHLKGRPRELIEPRMRNELDRVDLENASGR